MNETVTEADACMKVKVKVFATLREVMDKEIDLDLPESISISSLLNVLCDRYPGLYGELFDAPGTLKKFVNILKNGRNVYFINGLDTVLDDGDTIAMFPPLAGG